MVTITAWTYTGDEPDLLAEHELVELDVSTAVDIYCGQGWTLMSYHDDGAMLCYLNRRVRIEPA